MHPDPTAATENDTARYGRAEARAFERMHPKIESRGGWKDHQGQPPIKGTVISLTVERLPGNREPNPVWLWVSQPIPGDGAHVDHWWSMFLRRFGLEHTFEVPEADAGPGPAPPA